MAGSGEPAADGGTDVERRRSHAPAAVIRGTVGQACRGTTMEAESVELGAEAAVPAMDCREKEEGSAAKREGGRKKSRLAIQI